MGEKISYQTKNRKYILEYLESNHNRAVKVSDIAEYMKTCGIKVNITTIYRYLDKLVLDGVVSKFVSNTGDGATYQLTISEHTCHKHLHIQCTNCGKVVHLDCGFMEEISAHFLEHHGFVLDCAGTILHGLCKECQPN